MHAVRVRGDRLETPFEDIPDAQRDLRLDRAQAASDWAAAQGPLGGVILHLRHRAAATRRTALLFLFMLVVAIVIGLAFYLGLPFWQTWADGRQEALVETLAGIETRKTELDRDRKALLLGGDLIEGGKAPGLPALLRDAFVAIPTGTEVNLWRAVTHGDRLFVFGEGGTVRRLAADGVGFEEVPTGTEVALWSAVTHDDRLFVFGGDGTVRRLAADGAGFEEVPMGMVFKYSGAITHGDRLFTFGGAGIIHRFAVDGAGFEEVPTGTRANLRGAITYGDRLFVFGGDGTVLRLAADGARFEEVRTGTKADLSKAIILGDRLFVFGSGGTVRRLAADGAGFEAVPTGTEAVLWGAVTHGDRLFVFGEGGTIRRLTANGVRFEEVQTGTGATLRYAIILGDRLFVFGTGGTVRRLTADGTGFEEVPTGTEATLWYATNYGDRMFVFGADGTVLRLTADGTRFDEVPISTAVPITTAILHAERLFVGGDLGLVNATTNAFSDVAAALPVALDDKSRATVEAFFDETLPPHLRDWDPVRTLREDLRLVDSERTVLELIETRTRKDLTQLDESPLQYLRDRKVLDFKAFLDGCRGEAATADLTTACLTAWQTEQAAGQRSWWETLADQLPPGILLLFLLATLGGLYRYNLRLAGFHESRADALQLLAHGRDEIQLRDILAGTPGDAVNLATLFLAADKVEMGAIRAKLGQAEIELAKAMHSGE